MKQLVVKAEAYKISSYMRQYFTPEKEYIVTHIRRSLYTIINDKGYPWTIRIDCCGTLGDKSWAVIRRLDA